MVVLVALLWLPISSHALLQSAELIHQRHADHDTDADGSHEHDADNHEAADGRCVFSSTHINISVPDAVASPILFSWLGLGLTSEPLVEEQPSGLAPPGTLPPQLSHCWQFSSRTALPARAPSLIS